MKKFLTITSALCGFAAAFFWFRSAGRALTPPIGSYFDVADTPDSPFVKAWRAATYLDSDESLVVNYASSSLRMEMDRVPLWRENRVAIRQLVDDFGTYLYLPRLRTNTVLLNDIRAGLALLTWQQNAFTYAESYDELANRYRGLRSAQQVAVAADDPGLLVRPDAAKRQIEQETAPPVAGSADTADEKTPGPEPMAPGIPPAVPAQPPKPRRYHGTVTLDPARVGRDAGRIADEVLSHLVGIVGSSVRVTLEIEAEIPTGASDNVVRTVTENSRTLKFTTNSGFETE